MGIGRAARNLARTARANPMWALLGVLLAPFRFARHIIGVVLFALAVFLGLFALLWLAIWYFQIDKNGAVAQLGMIGISSAVLLVMVWLLVLPLLRRFDYDDRADTHGSARFASAGEAQALNDDHGLLIGRDVKTGKPMRHAGPAHLLTIAPTRTGKGVGTIIPNLLEYPFAVVYIDPKGENARIAARQRGQSARSMSLIRSASPACHRPRSTRYGVQLWPILQDVHQLRALYGQRADTFLSNAGVLQVFGVNDQDSAKLVSDLAGQETVVFETMSRAIDAEESGLSYGQQHVGRALLTPDEVRTLRPDRQLLFFAGQRPIVAAKLRYYADREFAGRFDSA